jgi:hypothetical protein
MDIPYSIIFGEPTLRPMGRVYLLGRTKRVLVNVLIDSGADYCVFPEKAAQDAGIVLPDHNRRVNFGDRWQEGKFVRTWFQIGEKRIATDVLFMNLRFPYGLLGRKGVFSQFREVAFMEKTEPKIVRLVE